MASEYNLSPHSFRRERIRLFRRPAIHAPAPQPLNPRPRSHRLLPPWSSKPLSPSSSNFSLSRLPVAQQQLASGSPDTYLLSLGGSCLGMHNQLVCSGCQRLLQYRRGATGVCCPGCNTFTAANPSGPEMSELVCGGCFTMLVYSRGATNIRCPHCSRLNSTRSAANQMGHLSCGQCRTTLAYPPGAMTVGCPTCRNINPVRDARPQTVLVENPKTLDEKGKLVSNVAVGVASWKR